MVTESELMKLKVPELKQKLQELGYQPRGLKADLARQLAAAYNSMEQINLQQQQQQQMQHFILQQQQQQPQFTNQMVMVDQIREQQQLIQQQQQQQQVQQLLQQQQQLQQQQHFVRNQVFVVAQEPPQQQHPMMQDLIYEIPQVREQQQMPNQVMTTDQIVVGSPQSIIPNQMFVTEQQESEQRPEQIDNSMVFVDSGQLNQIPQPIQPEMLVTEQPPAVEPEQTISNNDPIEVNAETDDPQSSVQNQTIVFEQDENELLPENNQTVFVADQNQKQEQMSNQKPEIEAGDSQEEEKDEIPADENNETPPIPDQPPVDDQPQELTDQEPVDASAEEKEEEPSPVQTESAVPDPIEEEPSPVQTESAVPDPVEEEPEIVLDQETEPQQSHVDDDNQPKEIVENKENDSEISNQKAKEVEEPDKKDEEEEEEFQEDNQQKLLQALNLTEEEWSKMSKNHRRKLKKKLRNKEKRMERDEIEKHRQEIRKKQKELEKQRLQKLEEQSKIKQENQDDDDMMDIDDEDAPEEEKELKRLEEIRKKQEESKKQRENEEKINDDTIEIEYVPEEIPKDPIYLQFFKVFNKFSAFSADEIKRLEQERLAAVRTKADDRAKMLELKKPVELELKDDDEDDDENSKLSKRKMKQMTRMSVADLKQQVTHPELVEMHDVTAKDPVVLLYLKSTRNTVPVPRHWCYKRKYLQGKRGFEKPPFKLPEFIRRTGIQEMREAVLEKEDAKSLKTKMKEKIRPKMGKIDIDYQKLHDAFFKWQTKPKMTIHGDLYYEGKEFETRLKDKKPGELTNELRLALGMPNGPNANKCPPPWLIAMQRYGPPPSYLSIKIPGLNAPIPEGCCFGYHAGGWGKPPVDEYGRPLYGDVFGATAINGEASIPEEEIDRTLWGEMESDEEDVEESEEEEEEDKDDKEENADESGLVTPSVNPEGLITPSGISTGIPSGLETPDMIELRKRKQQIESEMESGGDQQQLYTVVPEKKVDRFAKDMMGSMHVYDFASLSKSSSKSNNGVEVALDPSELESGQLDSTAVAAKYEQTLRESSAKNPHEDLSDMVAEYASKQKRKKHDAAKHHEQSSGTSTSGTSTSKSSKKFQFKF